MPRPPRLPPHTRQERGGLRTYLRVGGVLHTHRWAADEDHETILRWIQRTRATTFLRVLERPGRGTLADDAQRYLALVATMPTIATRTTQITLWAQALGANRDRRDVTADEISAQLLAWQREHHWAAGTVNRHRTALAHFYRVLDGPDGRNPVRSVPKLREPPPQPRGLSYDVVQAILDALPGRTTGKATTAPSKAAATLRVMASVGLTPAQIRQLAPEHLDLPQKRLVMPGRQKGAGTPPRRRALTDQGVAALKQFAAAKAWGGVASSTMLIVFRRAVKAVRRTHRRWAIPPDVRPYDLRHSFAELVYRTTRSLGVTAGLLGHLDEKTTKRYIGGAVEVVEQVAAADVSAALALMQREQRRAGRR